MTAGPSSATGRWSPTRPTPGTPRPYEFPAIARATLGNGLTVLVADLPGRPLGHGQPRAADRRGRRAGGRRRLDGPRGAGPDRGHRALRRDRPDRGLRAPRRLAPRRGRLGRHERRRRRAGVAPGAGPRAARRGPAPPDVPGRARSSACATSGSTTCSRPRPTRAAGPTRRSSGRSTRPASPVPPAAGRDPRDRRGPRPRTSLRRAYERTLDPARATLVVAGDLGGQDVVALADATLGGWTRSTGAAAGAAAGRRRRPGTGRRGPRHPSTGQRPDRDPDRPRRPAAADPGLPRGVGHERDPRRAVQLAAEHAAPRGEGLHVRRRRRLRPAPRRRPVHGARRGQHRGHRPGRASTRSPSSSGCATSRSPTTSWPRRATSSSASSRCGSRRPGAVVGALAGLAVHGLPLDELIDYRARIEAVDIDAIAAAARAHLARRSGGDRARRRRRRVRRRRSRPPAWARIVIDRDEGPHVPPRRRDDAAEAPGPIDEGDETGPTAGAEDPSLEGTADDPAAADARARTEDRPD